MTPLAKTIALLRRQYGPGTERLPTDPFELILWENVAYLADDARRRRAFELLRQSVGLQPENIRGAPAAALRAVTKHGILPEQFAAKLKRTACMAQDQFHGKASYAQNYAAARVLAERQVRNSSEVSARQALSVGPTFHSR